MRIPNVKSKRFVATIGFLILNYATFWLALFMGGMSMTEIGLGLATLNAPLYGYLFAETWRPSKTEQEIKPEVA